MKTIAALEKKLFGLRELSRETTDPEDKGNLEEMIDSIQDDIDELESDEQDRLAYEEATGGWNTTVKIKEA